MKELWILSVRTTLIGRRGLTPNAPAFRLYADFESARAATRKVLRKLAFSPNMMFDGKGHLIRLRNYTAHAAAESEGFSEELGDLTAATLSKVQHALRTLLEGKETAPPLPEGFYTDGLMALEQAGDQMQCYGWDDGPCNGIDPILNTNMFSMQQEKAHYYLYISDAFGQGDAPDTLFLDLQKVSCPTL